MGDVATESSASEPETGRRTAAPEAGREARWLALAAAALTVVPLVVALVAELFFSSARPLSTSDSAVLELHTLHAGRGEHLLGPYSQYFWNHPGPLYYYLLTPLYRLSGLATSSLYVTATLINAAALAAMGLLYFRHEQRLLARLGGCTLLLAFLADFTSRHEPSALTAFWNPVVTVLPFGLLLLVGATVAIGRVSGLPVLLVLHAFLIQTHVSYGPCATMVSLVAVGMLVSHWIRHRADRAASPRWSRSMLLALGLAVAVWLPPIIGELRSDTSNVAALVGHFVRGDSLVLGWRDAILYSARQFAAPVLRAVGLASASAFATNAALALALGQLGLLVLAFVRARRERRRFVAALAVLGLIATLVAAWSCRHIGNIGGKLHPYLTFWFALLSTINWATIVAAYLSALVPDGLGERTSRTRPGRAFEYWLLALAGFLSVSTCVAASRGYQRLGELSSPESAAAGSIEGLWAELLELGHGRAPVLRLEEHYAWRVLAGVVLQLEKRGYSPVLEERFRFIFGEGRDYLALGPDDPRGVFFSLEHRHDKPLLGRHGPVFLYLAPAARSRPPLPSAAALRDRGALSAPVARVVDGVVPADGTVTSAAGAVPLTAERAAITVGLPQVLVESVAISADGDDAYLVEGSDNGWEFEPLGVVPAVEGKGLQERHLELGRRGPWVALRVSPEAGTEPFAVAEITPVLAGWAARPVKAVDVERSPVLATDGEIPADGSTWQAAGALLLRQTSSLTLKLPPIPLEMGYVEGIRLSADCNDEYVVEGSRDGTRFFVIAMASPVEGWGLQTRELYFNDRARWSHLRIKPRWGDGSYSIGEVSLLTAEGLLIDMGTSAGRVVLRDGWSGDEASANRTWVWAVDGSARCEVPLRERVPYDLALTVGPVQADHRRQSIEVLVNERPLTRLPLATGMHTYHVFLPAHVVSQRNRLEFKFAFVVSPGGGDSRRLAARFETMVFTPLDEVGPWLTAAPTGAERSLPAGKSERRR